MMIKSLFSCSALILFSFFNTKAQDKFITIWNLTTSGTNENTISFSAETNGIVNYEWETVQSGAIGSGTFTGSSITISDLPTNASIRLKIDPTNFQKFQMDGSADCNRIIDIEQWGTLIWSSTSLAFSGCKNLQISATDTPNISNVVSMNRMFEACTNLNSPSNIGTWNTSNVEDMSYLFLNASSFNQSIGGWNIENVNNLKGIFSGAASFNQYIGNWNTINVTNMSEVFAEANSFNQDISSWNTSNTLNMTAMFAYASAFNQNISNWNTANVVSLSYMFLGASSFNQNIGNWNTSNVSTMNNMFNFSSFNQDISTWNTSNVSTMQSMFSENYAFNQDISSWDISNVTDMSKMFEGCLQFNQNLKKWGAKFNPSVNLNRFLNASGLSIENYDSLLVALNANTITGITLGAEDKFYCSAASERANLIANKGWTISDLGQAEPIILFETPSQTISGTNYGTIYAFSNAENPTFIWNSGETTQTIYPTVAGIYVVTITGKCGIAISNEMSITLMQTTGIISEVDDSYIFSIYPNPTTGQWFIETQNKVANNLHIYNSLGSVVHTRLITEPKTKISLDLPKGMYFVKLGSSIEKIFIE